MAFLGMDNYPTAGFNSKKGQNIHFSLLGDERMNCRMMAIKTGSAKIPDFEVSGSGLHEPLTGTVVKEGNIEYILSGNQRITISWRKS